MLKIVIKIKLVDRLINQFLWIFQRRIILHNKIASNKFRRINKPLLVKKRIENN